MKNILLFNKSDYISFLKKSKVLILIFYILINILNYIKMHFSRFSSKTGNRKENSKNILNYLKFCIKHIKFRKDKKSKIALEIGPGDNCALAIILDSLYNFDRIDLLDKFQKKDLKSLNNIKIYNKILKGLGIKNNSNMGKIKQLKNVNLLTLSNTENNKYNFIYSVSVLEHLWPLDKHLTAMSNILCSGGQMSHIVNFTDHNMFFPEHNPFYFRKLPRLLYDSTMCLAGRPNRSLPYFIISHLESLGLNVEIKVLKTHTRVLHDSEIYSINSIPKEELDLLFRNYKRELSNEEILNHCIGTAQIIANK